jgi:hypothetical protein
MAAATAAALPTSVWMRMYAWTATVVLRGSGGARCACVHGPDLDPYDDTTARATDRGHRIRGAGMTEPTLAGLGEHGLVAALRGRFPLTPACSSVRGTTPRS